jgi:hypothetical protein
MNEKHYKKEISAYLNHELPKEERQAIAEHLLQCENCRNEHDEIKLGAALASQLQRADAPENLWSEIKNALDEKKQSQISLLPRFSFFSSRGLAATALALLIGFGFVSAIYFGLFRNESKDFAKNEPTFIEDAKVKKPQSVSTPNEVLTNQNLNGQILSNINSNVQIQTLNANSNVRSLPEVNPIEPVKNPNEKIVGQNNLIAWNVETIIGTPKAGSQTILQNGKLAVGQFLETDANSRARVQVANIGQVEIAPNSRIQLVKTQSTEHRLSLELGVLHAKILAPPRLFIVDTPSAVAVDLGCEYTLEVDNEGNSKLHVTAGFVALERDGRESIVPAGAICFTRRGKGLGTPFFDDAAAEFQAALLKFDFENGGSESLQTIIKAASSYDTLTLWHLLSRVPKNEREKVFDAITVSVKPPASVTRGGILRLDKKMLELWRTEIEKLWFE